MTQMDARLRSDMNRLHEGMSHLRGDMTRLGERVTRIEHGQTRLEEHMTRLDDHVARLEHGQARLQGLLEGLREAITGRIASSCGPRAAKRGQSGCDSRPLVCAPMPQLIPIPQPILLERIYG
jgi:exonuclease VII small subunit